MKMPKLKIFTSVAAVTLLLGTVFPVATVVVHASETLNEEIHQLDDLTQDIFILEGSQYFTEEKRSERLK